MARTFDRWLLLKRTLGFYKSKLIWLALSCALTVMVLSGSLFIGDSVKGSLKRLAEDRCGQVEVAVFNSLNWFRADRAKIINSNKQGLTAAIINLDAQAENPSVNSISLSLYGVDDDFFQLAPISQVSKAIEEGKVYLNKKAAKELGCKVGDTLILSFFKPSFLPLDAPLTRHREGRVTTRVQVADFLSPSEFGNFDYRTTQTITANAFVSRQFLAKKLERAGFANCLLSNGSKEIIEKIKDSFDLIDLGLELRQGKQAELTSRGIFLSPNVVKAAAATGFEKEDIYTYFVNEIRCKEKSVPYSFVAGMSGAPLPKDIKDNELVVNDWLAKRLDCRVGDELELKAFRLNPIGHLYDETSKFKVRKIIPLAGAASDPSLMPPFPGMKDAKSCDDWEPGIPIELDLVGDDDEKYWEQYKGTPKAFCTLQRAQQLWSTRFGSLTAIRFPKNTIADVETKLKAHLPIRELGFRVRDLYKESTVGVNKAVDFSGLFIGLSFFVIVAALILCNLLFGFYLDERQSEIGLYRVLHFSESWLRFQLLWELLYCFLLGAIPGLVCGLAYAWLVLHLLGTIWQGAVNTQQITLIANLPTALIALFITLFVTFFTFWWKLRSFSQKAKATQLIGAEQVEVPQTEGYLQSGLILSILSLLVVTLFPPQGEIAKVAAFFIAGFMFLAGSTQLSLWFLVYLSSAAETFSLGTLALRNSLRRLDRSKAVIRLMACAIFLILAVTVNRKGMLKDPFVKTSGTGGFALFVQTTLPMTGDLNTTFGRRELKLSKLGKKVKVVPLPSSGGNEASCLNLNRVIRPKLLGIDISAFKGRFNFQGTLDGVAEGWECLSHSFSDDKVIPVVADAEVIMWSLGKGLGKDLLFENSQGETYKLRFVGGLSSSIFQGNVLVSRKNFYRLYPESSGYNTMLLDVPAKEVKETRETLAKALSRLGWQMQSCAERLAKFNSVQNTYLSIFLALGGLSLILGIVGLAILLKRNILERQKELYILNALKFSDNDIRKILFYEHFYLFASATICGLVSSALALIPALQSATGLIPWWEMSAFVAIILAAGFAILLSIVRVVQLS